MKDNLIKSKSTSFAIRIINLYKFLRQEQQEYVIGKQLLRSGTSTGANIREGIYAESTADFIHKYQIALKETAETEYWLFLLKETSYISESQYESINSDCAEIGKLLTSIIKSTRNKNAPASTGDNC